MGYKPEQVINGTWGEAWLDSDYISEVIGLEAKVTPKIETISQSRQLVDGSKITGLECKGTLKMNKISSRFIKLQSDNLKKGIQTEFTIISKLEDPSSLGCERIKLIGCTITELTLVDWELFFASTFCKKLQTKVQNVASAFYIKLQKRSYPYYA